MALAGAPARTASAAPPDPDLLARLSHDEQALEAAGRSASYRAEETIEELDGDGKVTSTKKTHYRVESDGKKSHKIVETAIQDGKDVTAEEREKVRAKEAKAAQRKLSEEERILPFAPRSQVRYTYDQVAVDPANPAYVEIAFAPKSPDGHTFEGKAWVDTVNARILSASVKLSEPPTFVDWVHFTVEFGATPVGHALSHLSFEGAGGLLFIHKHFRGEIKMSGFRVSP